MSELLTDSTYEVALWHRFNPGLHAYASLPLLAYDVRAVSPEMAIRHAMRDRKVWTVKHAAARDTDGSIYRIDDLCLMEGKETHGVLS